MHRPCARQRLARHPITIPLMQHIMRRLFNKLNDFNPSLADYDELLIELHRWGIFTRGAFERLMKKHRKALLAEDSARMSEREICFLSLDMSPEEALIFRRHARQGIYLAYQGLIRTALELEFGAEANPVVTPNTNG